MRIGPGSINRRHFIGGTLALGAAALHPPDQAPGGAARRRSIAADRGARERHALAPNCRYPATGLRVGINRDRRVGTPRPSSIVAGGAAVGARAAGAIDCRTSAVMWSEADMLPARAFPRERMRTRRDFARSGAGRRRVTSDIRRPMFLLRDIGGPQHWTAFHGAGIGGQGRAGGPHRARR